MRGVLAKEGSNTETLKVKACPPLASFVYLEIIYEILIDGGAVSPP
jgi:hypothetical protein